MRQLIIPGVALGLLAAAQAAAQTHLRHVGRYDTHFDSYRDHLMGVEVVGHHYALISSYLDIALIDLESLPPEGTDELLARYEGFDVTSTITIDDHIVYANLRLGGVAILELSLDPPSLDLVHVIDEENVYFDRMFIEGDLLYVTAHADGLRVYDRSNPWEPTLVDSLQEGLTDAFAIAVDGERAFVADGAGGLKILDVSGPSVVVVDGETVETSVGTSSDVLVHDGVVYVAAGGAGVTAYIDGDLSTRMVVDTPISAKQIELLGDRLLVADMGSARVLDIGLDGAPIPLASEGGRRRLLEDAPKPFSLRFWHGVAAWGDDRVLAANWDAMDVYELVEASDQADVTASTQQLRFSPTGGQQTVELRSMGGVPLEIVDVTTADGFATTLDRTVVAPGESALLEITYAGGPPGAGLVLVHTNDPDENPLPIEVYGDTVFLDPGEPAAPFVLESWRFDHETQDFVIDTFSLEACAGRIVYFHVFGIW